MTADLEFSEAVTGLGPTALRAAATLHLADHIAAGHDTVPGLADATKTDPDVLARLLRFLAARDVLAEPTPGTYSLTPLSATLLDGHPAHLRAWLDQDGIGARMDAAVHDLLRALRSGEPPYPRLHGRDYYADLADHQDGPAFDTLRHTHATGFAAELVDAHPWHQVRHVVDVGGGTGALVETLMRRFPGLHTTLVDLPDAVAAAVTRISAAGYGSRFTPAPGSFLDPLPTGADVYTLVNVLHNWDDDHAVQILRRCAATPNATVIVVERLADDTDPRAMTAMDLRMFLFLGGRERGREHFHRIAAAAGFSHVTTVSTPSGLALLKYGS
ncbi:methyltransferase [Streptomyces sp. HUAS TT7]|uniref:methyltransferase n=1 Tax=Streptomyces sp. HUAS TT7 TaxID=3447507 RepID=UPI003F65B3BE